MAADDNPKFKAILSDAGGILFDDEQMKLKEYGFVSKFREMTYRDFLKQFYPYKRRAQLEPSYSKRQAFTEYVADNFQPLIVGVMLDDYPDYEKAYNEEHFAEPARLVFPGVKPTLDQIAEKGVPFIVVTDSTQTVEGLMQGFYTRTGLAGRVTDIISSKDARMKKPDKRLFRHALKKHGLKKKEVIFVAHDYDELKGAHDQGFFVAAFRYRKSDREKGRFNFIRNGVFIERFQDILEYI